MESSRSRWSGLAAAVAGLLTLVMIPLQEFVSGEFFMLVIPVLILVAVALPGLHKAQQGRDGRIGRLGAALGAVGAGIIALLFIVEAAGGVPGWMEVFFAIGPLLFAAGILLFGTGTLKASVYPRPACWLLLYGFAFGFAAEIVEQSFTEAASIPAMLGFAGFSVGLAWIGYSVRSEMRPRSEVRA